MTEQLSARQKLEHGLRNLAIEVLTDRHRTPSASQIDQIVGDLMAVIDRHASPSTEASSNSATDVVDERDEACFAQNCHQGADWVRRTQFAGNHYYCDAHARQEEDFGQTDPGYFIWEDLRQPVQETTLPTQ
jgi:hypothetical protein